jgi:hypothetical protein
VPVGGASSSTAHDIAHGKSSLVGSTRRAATKRYLDSAPEAGSNALVVGAVPSGMIGVQVMVQGKVDVVTGSGSGIGRATARECPI